MILYFCEAIEIEILKEIQREGKIQQALIAIFERNILQRNLAKNKNHLVRIEL